MISFVEWKEALAAFSSHLKDALANAEHGIRLGGQPESVTTNTLVHPLLRMLGYEPARMQECVPQGRPQSPSKSGESRFMKASVDLCLFPEGMEGRIPMEVKTFSVGDAALRDEVRQIDMYMRFNRSPVGIKTNGRLILVFALPDRAERDAAPKLVGEFDLANLRSGQAEDLFHLHRRRFTERYWTSKAAPNKATGMPPTIEFARVQDLVLSAIREKRPSLSQSDIIRSAILEGVPKIKQLEIGVEGYFRRVWEGELVVRPIGFKTDHHPQVQSALEELHRRYPKRGTRQGRFSADTVIGFLVEDWARSNGVLNASPERAPITPVLIQKPIPAVITSTSPVVGPLPTSEPSMDAVSKGYAIQIAETLATHDDGIPVRRMWHPQASPETVGIISKEGASLPPARLLFQHPTVVLMIGVSGAGKTAWMREHLGHLSPTMCSADDFCVDLDGNWYWSHETVLAAHAICKRLFNESIAEHHPLVVVDNQNLMAQHRQHYLDWARKHGYQCFLVVLDCDLGTAFERNTHGVTLKGITRQHQRLDLGGGVHYIPFKNCPPSP